jgi:hypothetical protein
LASGIDFLGKTNSEMVYLNKIGYFRRHDDEPVGVYALLACTRCWNGWYRAGQFRQTNHDLEALISYLIGVGELINCWTLGIYLAAYYLYKQLAKR